MKWVSVFLLFSIALCVRPVLAAESALDLNAEFSHPGVKLVVVEFFSTYCEPCMKAIPKWQALHEKYRKDGLRFIVVSADEDVCARPLDWTPDKTLCDPDGSIRKRFAQMMGSDALALPTSFLFSWEGKLALVSHHSKPVDAAIRAYFKDTNYRIGVEPVQVIGDKYAIGSNESWVRDEVIERIREMSRFDVVSAAAEPTVPSADGVCTETFPSNSTLRIRLQGHGDAERMIILELEKDGCVKAKSTETYTGKGFNEDRESLRKAIRLGVRALLHQVVRVARPMSPQEQKRAASADPGTAQIVEFKTEPEGVDVWVDNRKICTTPCTEIIQRGRHTLMMKAEGFPVRSERIEIFRDGVLFRRMGAAIGAGWLTVTSQPNDQDVRANGDPLGQTPLKEVEMPPGAYKVQVGSACYQEEQRFVRVESNETTRLHLDLKQTRALLDVSADNRFGDAVVADVYVDDEWVGRTPGQFQVGLCSKKLELKLDGYDAYEAALSLSENGTQRINASITRKLDPRAKPSRHSGSAPEQQKELSPEKKNAVTGLIIAGACLSLVGAALLGAAAVISNETGETDEAVIGAGVGLVGGGLLMFMIPMSF